MGFSRAEKTLAKAVAKAPITVRKQRKPTPYFKAWTVAQLLETYRDPRAVLMEIASTDTAVLADKIKCTLLEAQGERRLCAQYVLPYVAQKLPVQVDMRHTRAIHLNIVDATQYQELQQIAQGDEAMAMQLVTGQVIESAIADSEREDGETDGGENSGTGVQPAVVADAPQDADSAIVDKALV